MPESEPRWEKWLIDPEFTPLPNGSVAVWFGEEHRYYALPKALASRIIADHDREQENARLREQVAHAEEARQIALDQWDECRTAMYDAEAAAAGLLRALKEIATRTPHHLAKGVVMDEEIVIARAAIADAETKGIKDGLDG